MKHITESVSFHIVKPCNMNCKFCYDTFNDSRNAKQLDFEQVQDILWKLKSIGVKKVTFLKILIGATNDSRNTDRNCNSKNI